MLSDRTLPKRWAAAGTGAGPPAGPGGGGGGGVRALACDQRGYSPKASPPDASAYSYERFGADALALADAAGFGRFHLVGHDHGAGLGWQLARANEGGRVLSFVAMSVPHPDAFGAALAADIQVQAASNYFNQVPHGTHHPHRNYYCDEVLIELLQPVLGGRLRDAQRWRALGLLWRRRGYLR